MNLLTDVIPAKGRKYVYAAIAFGALVWGCFEASDGDWKKFVGGLVVALTSSMAASNTGGESEQSSDDAPEFDGEGAPVSDSTRCQCVRPGAPGRCNLERGHDGQHSDARGYWGGI